MTNSIQSIPLDKLIPHPDNPNRMTQATFTKLVRHIKQTGHYEPLIVRPHPSESDRYEIINGHHRCLALKELRREYADVLIWNVNDQQVDMLLVTLNRLSGSDVLEKKRALFNRLSNQFKARELARLLPATAKQIERLTTLQLPANPTDPADNTLPRAMVFFVNNQQQQTIEQALTLALKKTNATTKAEKRTQALTHIARRFIHTIEPD